MARRYEICNCDVGGESFYLNQRLPCQAFNPPPPCADASGMRFGWCGWVGGLFETCGWLGRWSRWCCGLRLRPLWDGPSAGNSLTSLYGWYFVCVLSSSRAQWGSMLRFISWGLINSKHKTWNEDGRDRNETEVTHGIAHGNQNHFIHLELRALSPPSRWCPASPLSLI
jgi:hypothetical protein